MADAIELEKVAALNRIATALETLAAQSPSFPKIADALESITATLTYCVKPITKDGKLAVDVSGFINSKQQQ
jgi:hypothetical protein